MDRRIARDIDRRRQLRVDRPPRFGQATATSCAWTSRHSIIRRNETKCARHASTRLRCDSAFCARARRRIPTARSATGNRSGRRESAGAPGRRPARARAAARAGPARTSALAITSASARHAVVARGEHDAADPRIERQLRELAAQRRQRARRIDGVELLQQLVAVGDRPRRRRIEERKRGDVAERRAPPSAGSPPRASCAGSPDRCTPGARAKSSSPYRRTQMPSATRPQRPARWLADACEIFSICSSVVLLRTE